MAEYIKLGACLQGIGINCGQCPIGQSRRQEMGFSSGDPASLLWLAKNFITYGQLVDCPYPELWR